MSVLSDLRTRDPEYARLARLAHQTHRKKVRHAEAVIPRGQVVYMSEGKLTPAGVALMDIRTPNDEEARQARVIVNTPGVLDGLADEGSFKFLPGNSKADTPLSRDQIEKGANDLCSGVYETPEGNAVRQHIREDNAAAAKEEQGDHRCGLTQAGAAYVGIHMPTQEEMKQIHALLKSSRCG